MNTERIYPIKSRIESYRDEMTKKKRKRKSKPIDAVTIDVLELSEDTPEEGYSWLVSMVKNIPDTVIEDKLRLLKHGTLDINDAIAESVMRDII